MKSHINVKAAPLMAASAEISSVTLTSATGAMLAEWLVPEPAKPDAAP